MLSKILLYFGFFFVRSFILPTFVCFHIVYAYCMHIIQNIQFLISYNYNIREKLNFQKKKFVKKNYRVIKRNVVIKRTFFYNFFLNFFFKGSISVNHVAMLGEQL